MALKLLELTWQLSPQIRQVYRKTRVTKSVLLILNHLELTPGCHFIWIWKCLTVCPVLWVVLHLTKAIWSLSRIFVLFYTGSRFSGDSKRQMTICQKALLFYLSYIPTLYHEILMLFEQWLLYIPISTKPVWESQAKRQTLERGRKFLPDSCSDVRYRSREKEIKGWESAGFSLESQTAEAENC